MKVGGYLLLSLVVLVISCGQNERDINNGLKRNYEAFIVDSLVVNHMGALLLVDASEDYFLGVDDFTHNLVIFNQEGSVISNFPNSDGSSNKPAKIISAGFIGDSLIMATSHQFISFYSLQGELRNSLPTNTFVLIKNNNLHLDLEDIYISGTPYVIYFHEGSKNLPIQQSRYWRETKLITLMNLNSRETTSKLSYEKNSIYRHRGEFFYKYKQYFTLNFSKTEMYWTYQLDKNIYIYDLTNESLSLKDKISTHPQNFEGEPTHSKFGSGSEKEMLIANATDSRYSAIGAIGDSIIIVQYGTYAPKNSITGNESSQELLEKWINHYLGYLEIYDRFSKEKISKDIRLDNRLWNLKLTKSDTLFFEDFYFDDEKEKSYNVFYKVILK